ncbi:hypothetical protein HPB47_018129, partial [Ixodes persulcatus]
SQHDWVHRARLQQPLRRWKIIFFYSVWRADPTTNFCGYYASAKIGRRRKGPRCVR